MNVPSFFGGDSGVTYEQLQARKKIARELMGGNGQIRTVGEGINSAAQSIAGALMNRRANKAEEKLRGEFNDHLARTVGPEAAGVSGLASSPFANDAQKKMIVASLANIPQFAKGTKFAPGGLALVGEQGPEIVNIPRGAQVVPVGYSNQTRGSEEWFVRQAIEEMNKRKMDERKEPAPEVPMSRRGDRKGDPFMMEYLDKTPEEAPPVGSDMYFQQRGPTEFNASMDGVPDDRRREFEDMTPEEKRRVLEQLQGGQSPDDAFNPEGWSPADPNARFDDGAAYQTADMTNFAPAGVGEQAQLHAQARAFQGFMKSLADYESMFKDDSGKPKDDATTMWPGKKKDRLSTAHRDLQMQLKELYNLGVLNGPDLSLMEQVLLNPTTVGGNVMDALGIADMEKRIPANISEVRRMMINRTEPVLQQLGATPDDFMPKPKDLKDLSDEDLLKALQGS